MGWKGTPNAEFCVGDPKPMPRIREVASLGGDLSNLIPQTSTAAWSSGSSRLRGQEV
jgi:hypothetical protein